MSRLVVFSHDRLHVDAVRRDDGSVLLEGQDLRGEEEYEYVFTIAAADVPALVAALGGGDPLEGLARNADAVINRGEMHWLDEHGVPYELTTH